MPASQYWDVRIPQLGPLRSMKNAPVSHIMKAAAYAGRRTAAVELAYGYHEDRTPTHGYAATREAAMAAFAKSWRRE